MKKSIFLIIYDIILLMVATASVVRGHNITYKVISNFVGSGYQMAVIIDKDTTPFLLSASPETAYLFTGAAPVATVGYRYAIIDNHVVRESELFLRSPILKDSYNEYYNRSFSTYSLPTFGQLYPPLSCIHRIDTEIHLDDHIPTFFFSGDEAGVDKMHSNVLEDTKVVLDLTYIGLNKVKTLAGVKLKIGGRGTRFSTKASYKISLDKEDNLFGYRKIKLRSLTTDPSYVREKISYDLIRAFGLASSGYSYARIFINNKPYGLFGVQEDYENPWLVNEFNNGIKEDYSQGILYSGSINASLTYLGDNETLYSAVGDNIFGDPSYEIKENPSKGGEKLTSNFHKLISFIKFLVTTPTTQSEAVAIWNEQIDTDSVIRSLAIEILVGNSDGYISGRANYYLYSDPSQNGRLIYIPSDMDMTLGSSSKYMVIETIPSRCENYIGFNSTRPLLHNILKVPEFKSKFEDILKTTIRKQISNPDFLYSRINALSILIKEDVDWDKSIPRNYITFPIAELEKHLTMAIDSGQLVGSPFLDYFNRIQHNNISFEEAVNGTINRPSIMGVKEWISKMTSSYMQANP